MTFDIVLEIYSQMWIPEMFRSFGSYRGVTFWCERGYRLFTVEDFLLSSPQSNPPPHTHTHTQYHSIPLIQTCQSMFYLRDLVYIPVSAGAQLWLWRSAEAASWHQGHPDTNSRSDFMFFWIFLRLVFPQFKVPSSFWEGSMTFFSTAQ